MRLSLNFFRSCVFACGYFIFTTSYGALSLPLRLLPPMVRHRVIISWTHLIIWWAKITCGIRYRIVGKENLTNLKMPIVVLSKHQSAWETFFLQGLFWPASTVLKKELLKMPFFGWGLSALRPIGIDRNNPREALRQVKEQGAERLAEGTNLLLFPEGTRVPVGERGKYARSGADIAKLSGCMVVPVSHDAGIFWGEGKSFVKTPGVITIAIGKAINPDCLSSKEIIHQVEEWIETTQTQILDKSI